MKYLLLFGLIFAFHLKTEAINLRGIAHSVGDISKGVVVKIPDAIPKPKELFEAGKNVIAGYPLNEVINILIHFLDNSLIKISFTGFFHYQHIL